MKKVTVVTCTYNRCESLKDTLASLLSQELERGIEMEIVVIDNNSKDATLAVVREAAEAKKAKIHYVLETQQGIGFARNRGLVEARGDYALFIDDDAIADPQWVVSMVRAFEETKADLLGGKIEPYWLTPRPEWLTEDLLGPIVKLDYGPSRKRCQKDTEAFLTTNVGFRLASLQKYGIFDSSLGRRGNRWIGGEDFELYDRWVRKGASVYYIPEAVVRHKVEPERLTAGFYRKWYRDIGYTQAHQLGWKSHYRWIILPYWRWRLLITALGRYVWTRVTRKSANVKLHAELWCRFQWSFFQERLDHWFASWTGHDGVKCRFSKAN